MAHCHASSKQLRNVSLVKIPINQNAFSNVKNTKYGLLYLAFVIELIQFIRHLTCINSNKRKDHPWGPNRPIDSKFF